MVEENQPKIPMCPRCVKEKAEKIGTLAAVMTDGVFDETQVNCQYHGNYPAEEARVLVFEGFGGHWFIGKAESFK